MIKIAFEKNKSLFIPFMMAGHPDIQTSTEAALALWKSGADMIELGVPFSDPVADGPVNQHAADIALGQGVNLSAVFELVKKLRLGGCDIPLILFSYLNPILSFGYEKFALKAKEVGVNGVLVVDLPPEEYQDFAKVLRAKGIDIVLLVSPTTDKNRFDLYKSLEPAFLYYISRLSVTGIQKALSTHLESEIQAVRAQFPLTKIAVGFGISNAQQASQVAQFSDGVIIGSLLVKTLEEQGVEGLRVLAQELAKAIHL